MDWLGLSGSANRATHRMANAKKYSTSSENWCARRIKVKRSRTDPASHGVPSRSAKPVYCETNESSVNKTVVWLAQHLQSGAVIGVVPFWYISMTSRSSRVVPFVVTCKITRKSYCPGRVGVEGFAL